MPQTVVMVAPSGPSFLRTRETWLSTVRSVAPCSSLSVFSASWRRVTARRGYLR